MYKYFYNGDVHTARDYFEARLVTGRRYPRPFRSFSHYVVRLLRWDPVDRDYTIEDLSEQGHQIFNHYDEAVFCFHRLAAVLPGKIQEDVKLELIQNHLGREYSLQTRILCSPSFIGSC